MNRLITFAPIHSTQKLKPLIMPTKKIVVPLLLLFFTTAFAEYANAQYRRVREREEEKEAAKQPESKLWYGGGVNIGLGGFGGFNSFNFGISPMVGYKIVRNLSAGPRVAYDFTSLKQRGSKSLNLHSFDAGVFLRLRAFLGLFLQGEISNQWYQDIDYSTGNKIQLDRVNQRIGAGWNFGQPGGTGSEISVLYNFAVANEIDTWQNPIEYRFGFTWKF